MKDRKITNLLIPFLLVMALMINASKINAQNELKVFPEWASTTGSQNFFFKNVVKTDASNNVYIAGATKNGSGNYDILVAKYNRAGVQQWIQQYNGAGNGDDMATSLFVDASSNVYITGTVTTATNIDAITIKYNSSGTQQWLSTYNGTGSSYDSGAEVKVDAFGNVFITGSSYNASGNTDIIAIKYNSSGVQQFVSRYNYTSNMNDAGVKLTIGTNIVTTGVVQTATNAYKMCSVSFNLSTGAFIGAKISATANTTGIDVVNDMVEDAAGNIYIAGGVPIAGEGYNYDIIKLNSSDLSIAWERTYNTSSNLDDIASGIRLDASGNVYVTGTTTSTTQNKNMTTIKYNSSGTQQWVQTYNDSLNGNDEANAIALDASNNVYITGYITTEIDKKDYQTIKYNNSGTEIWTIHSDAPSHLNDIARDIAIDNNGDILIAGESETGPNAYTYYTIKYIEKSILTPTDFNSETPPSSFSYYRNMGQLIGTNDSLVPSIKYNVPNSNPQFYIKNNSASFVFARIDTSANTPDTLHRVDITYDRLNSASKTYPLEERKDYLNYFLGHCPNGVTEVRGNERLITTNLYNNIDLMYSSNQDGIKYYYIVKPGGNPADIQITYTGANSFNLDGSTNALTINTSIGSLTYERPTAYQVNSSNTVVPITGWQCAWQTNGASNKYKFYTSTYNTALPLIIQVDLGHNAYSPTADRNLMHSTYYGGTGQDYINDVTTDNIGNVYITGNSRGPTFPTVTGTVVLSNNLNNNNPDAFVVMYNSNLQPLWGTFFGGGHSADVAAQGTEESHSIVADNLGHIYFGGFTCSSNLPWFNPGGGAYIDTTLSGSVTTKSDMFIAKLDILGNRLWATYLGGSADTYYERIYDMTINNNGELYVVGSFDNNTPIVTKAGSTNDSTGRCYIAKFDINDSLIWATRFGGNGSTERIISATVDVNNNLLITGKTNSTTFHHFNPGGGAYYQTTPLGYFDAFIAKFDSNDLLCWSTFFGGNLSEEGNGIASDYSGNIYITGFSTSTANFPFYNPASGLGSYHGPNPVTSGSPYGDVFIAKFNSSCVPQVSELYGGSKGEVGLNITVDASNRVYVTGATVSSTFPELNNSPSTLWSQNALSNSDDGNEDAFLIAFNNSLVPLWATFYGGGNGYNGADWGTSVVTFQNKLYMVGVTNSITAKIPLNNMGGGTWYQSSLANTLAVNDGFFAYFDLGVLPLSINEVNIKADDIVVFPNPVLDGQNISICVNIKKPTDINIEIFDLTGKNIVKQSYNNLYGKQIIKVNIEDYANGMYFIKVFDENTVVTKKIIKQ